MEETVCFPKRLARFSHGLSLRAVGEFRGYKACEGKCTEAYSKYVENIFRAQRSRHGTLQRRSRLTVRKAGQGLVLPLKGGYYLIGWQNLRGQCLGFRCDAGACVLMPTPMNNRCNIGLQEGGDRYISKWYFKKIPFPRMGKRYRQSNSNRRPVSLRRYYPDQVVKGCPFPDSQMIPTPLTRRLYHKTKFSGCQVLFYGSSGLKHTFFSICKRERLCLLLSEISAGSAARCRSKPGRVLLERFGFTKNMGFGRFGKRRRLR